MEATATAKKAATHVRALVFPLKEVRKQGVVPPGDDPGQSKQVIDDPFGALTIDGTVIVPPFELLELATLPEKSSELGRCISAMEVNIDGFGHRIIPRVDLDKDGVPDVLSDGVRQEKVFLENFFAYASLDESFVSLRRKVRVDLESTGNGYLEVIRSSSGKIQGFAHVPSYQVRLTIAEREPCKVSIPIHELKIDGSVEVVNVPAFKHFRRFVQAKLTGVQGLGTTSYLHRWFKEFGDPRCYDNETGKMVPPEKLAEFPESKRANEIVHFKIYSARSPYGLPRYIGNLLSVYGDRGSEEINYTTFRSNNIPSMAVLVSNGQLTEGSIQRIESFTESQIQGSDNYSKFLLIEAEGALEGEDQGQVKVEIKPLTQDQHKDALFQNYSKNNAERIRGAWRLPPILIGRADDYTRATADTSRRLADEQIFAPERDEFDNWINRRLFPEMGVRFHKFKSNSPNTTDNTELVKILSDAEKTGGMTPRVARLVLEDILGRELPALLKREGFDPDLPFSLAMAEAVKNKAAPNEVGQQVTALKALGFLGSEDRSGGDEEMIARVERIRDRLEKRWRLSSVTPGEE